MVYDYAIIGAGAAGLQLALRIQEDVFFREKKILILEKDDKSANDRTWCFWEKGNGRWDHLLFRVWDEGLFHARNFTIPLHLAPYRYKMLRSADFYRYAKARIQGNVNFSWQHAEVLKVSGDNPFEIHTKDRIFKASTIFDSRIPTDFFCSNGHFAFTRILQHFKGWIIHTTSDCFDPDRFTMMDYRLAWNDSTAFVYILPFSPREALVEFTLFTEDLLADSGYDDFLETYCRQILGISEFEIKEVEKGVIPMSDFPFWRYSKPGHFRIGTAGGWVKASTGYSFKNCDRKVVQILNNLKNKRSGTEILSGRRRFWLYDSVFLDVLRRRNDRGPELFTRLYQHNRVPNIFSFLDEETTPWEEATIIWCFPKWLFIKSLMRILGRRIQAFF